MMLVLCTAVFLFFILIDVIPIVRAKQWKVLIIYSAIFVTAYTFNILYEIGVKIYSPSYPIKHVITAIFGG